MGDGRAAPPYFVYGKQPLISHVGARLGLVKMMSSDKAERRRRTLCTQYRPFIQKPDGLVRKMFLGDGRAAPPYFVYAEPVQRSMPVHPPPDPAW